MPFASSGLVTLRPDLAQSIESFDLAMDRLSFIGLDIAKKLDVAEPAGTFGIIPIEQLLQNQDTARAPGSGYKRGRFSFKPAGFATAEHGWEEPVDENEARTFANYFKAEQYATARSLDFTLRGMELRIANLVQSTANITNNAAAATVWSDHANATPIEDVETAIETVWKATGLWPNVLALSKLAFRHLRNNAEVIDRVKYSGFIDPRAGKITAEAIAQVFDIERVLITGSAQNTANEGQAANIVGTWDSTKVLLARCATTEDPKEPCLARVFHWAEDGSDIAGTVESYPEPQTRSDVYRCRNQTDELLIQPLAGYLITGVMTTNGGPS